MDSIKDNSSSFIDSKINQYASSDLTISLQEAPPEPQEQRAGASASSDLPMILVLNEQDELFSTFDLDAQTVMEELGIKRSRLTQISGRELRVARKKMGQYIRPMYRREDVDEYKSWSRATATHQKASNMVQQAADSLEQKALDLTHTLSSSIAEFTNLLKESFHLIRSDLLQDKRDKKELLDKLEDRLSTTVNQSTNIHQEFLQNSSSSILDKLSVLEQKNLSVEDIKLCLNELVANTSNLFKEELASFQLKLEKLQESLLQLENSQNQISLSLKSILQFQKEQLLKTEYLLKQDKKAKKRPASTSKKRINIYKKRRIKT